MITRRQRKAMLYIQEYMDASGGVAPSYLEICAHVGLKHKSSAHRVIHALRQRGYIRTLPHRARAIEILKPVKPLYAAYVFDDETKELRRM